MDLKPIKLNFYNDQDEVIKEYSRSRIPTYMLDMAIGVQKAIENDKTDESAINALLDFIVEFYGKQFTIDDLKKSTDLVECMSIIGQVLGRANQLASQFAKENPPVPSSRKR